MYLMGRYKVKLSEEKIERFRADGFLVLKGLLDAGEVATLLERAEWVAAHLGLRPQGALSASLSYGSIFLL